MIKDVMSGVWAFSSTPCSLGICHISISTSLTTPWTNFCAVFRMGVIYDEKGFI